MSRMAPKNYSYHHKQVQRLFFPRNDDPSLYSHVGRKHYVDKISVMAPYALFSDNQRSSKDLFSNKSHFDVLKANQKFKPQQKLKFPDLKNYQSAHKQLLDTQPDRQNSYNCVNQSRPQLERHSVQQIKKKVDLLCQKEHRYEETNKPHQFSSHRPSRMRINTESQVTYNPRQEQELRKPLVRYKTQKNEPGIVKSYSRPSRFNPTFLSSVNC